MTYDVRPSPTARRNLQRLPETVAAAVIKLLEGPLAVSPRRIGKPLSQPFEGRYSARRGDYRVIYTVDDEAAVVIVLRIAHRRDASRR